MDKIKDALFLAGFTALGLSMIALGLVLFIGGGLLTGRPYSLFIGLVNVALGGYLLRIMWISP